MRFLPLFLVSLTFGAFASTAFGAQSVDRLEASVNSSLILTSDVADFRRTEKLRTQLDPLFTGTTVAAHGDKATTDEIVQFLIDERLIAQAFPVSENDVEQEINSIQSNNKIDRTTLKSALKEQGFSFDDYYDMIRASASKRNLIDRDIRTKVTISDDDVKNYYYAHNSTTADPEDRAYHLKLIFISTKAYKKPSAAKSIADRAKKDIDGGEAFEEVARRVSHDASASSGGDLGTLTEDQMSPQIREGIKSLQIGQVSPVFGSAKKGYYIVKLIEMKTNDGARLGKLKEQIRAQMIAAEYHRQIGLWLERQRQGAFIHIAGQPAISGIPGLTQ